MSFIKNVAKLTAGTTVSQILNIALMPIITRMFLPEAFGDLAVFTSITIMLGSIITLRYELAIVLPKEESKAVNLLSLCLIFTVLITLLVFAISVPFGDRLFKLFNLSIGSYAKYFIALMLLFTGVFVSFDNWSIRKGYFGLISMRRVSQSVTTQLSRIAFGMAGFVTGGYLIVSALLGQMLASITLACNILKRDKISFRENVTKQSLIDSAKRYKDFPKYSTCSNFLNIASQNEPALFLAYFFDTSVVGMFALGKQVLSVPMGFIGKSVSQVYFQKASQSLHGGKNKLAYVVEHTFDKLFIFALFPFLVLTFFGKELFVFVFGGQWSEAGVYAQILGLTIFVNFLASILSTTFTVLEMQKEGLVLVSIFFVTRLTALCSGFIFDQPRLVLFVYAIVELVTRVFQCGWILKASGASVSKYMLRYLVSFFIVVTVLLYLKYINIGNIYILLSALMIISGIYYLYVMLNDRMLRIKVLSLIGRRE